MAARLATAAATIFAGRFAAARSTSRVPLQRRHVHVAFSPKSNRAAAFVLAPAWRRFSVRAVDVSGPGSIDSLISGMESKIKEQLKAQEVIIKDAYGDGRHVSIEVVAEAFEGQSAVNRQRMVYKAIWEELQNAVHAVDQLKTKTPAEAAKPSL